MSKNIDFSRIDRFVVENIEKTFPGASLAIYKKGEKIYEKVYGYSEIVPERRKVQEDTIFDLASLTKPLVTSLLTAKLVEEGLLHLRDKVSKILPEYSMTEAGFNEEKNRTEIWMLLTHSACLPSWMPLYKIKGKSRKELLIEASRSFITCSPGTQALYSDIGYIVMTLLIERITGERIDRLFEKMIAKPLGLEKTMFNPLEKNYPINKIASTELLREENIVLKGVVHDENARALDGVSGHAGLFSTADEVGMIVNEVLQSYLGKSDLLIKPATARSFLRKIICGDRCYSLGWMIYESSSAIFCGDLMSPGKAFGHTGFTGTSVCADPDLDIVIVFLSNRVHPTRENNKIIEFRPRFHNLVVSTII
jgi:CubicO group peptidase (beta-lactamase class C family)